MLAEILRYQSSHSLLVEVKNGPTTLEKLPAVFYKTKHRPTLRASSSTPRCLPERNETYIHKNTCTRITIAGLFIIA